MPGTLSVISTTPADGETFADIADVEIIWEPSDPVGDPLDLTEFTVSRDAVNYDVTVIPFGLPTGRAKVVANVGLFPGDLAITIDMSGKTQSGAAASDSFTFDCRNSMQGPVSYAEFFKQTSFQNAALAELNYVSHVSGVHTITSIFVPIHLYALHLVADLTAADRNTSFDNAIASISATRPIRQILAYITTGAGVEIRTFMQRTLEVHDSLVNNLGSYYIKSTGAYGEKIIQYLITTDVGILSTFLAMRSLGVGIERIYLLYESLDIQNGPVIEAFIDILDEILNEIR